MTSIMINMFLLGLLVFIAVMILRTGKLFAVIVMSGGYSLTSAAIFVNLDAVDVAFTEAAVGAGIAGQREQAGIQTGSPTEPPGLADMLKLGQGQDDRRVVRVAAGS